MRLIYFAWVRERIGKPQEDVELPADIATVVDLLHWLKARGEGYEQALQYPEVIRVAIDHEHVGHGERLEGAKEVALFPPMTGG
ncbi:MAG TPA: molybdopterin converting factor subunit 1 [Mesorhizobium sp.]|nr:molybdopterin converting factor subunit 1 [Mesorhizobium sp.]